MINVLLIITVIVVFILVIYYRRNKVIKSGIFSKIIQKNFLFLLY